tara:strand:- start:33 stop:350 length:318 start_codon:yes stop_codon:yes gene_type:complete
MLVAIMDYLFVMMMVSGIIAFLPLGKYISEQGSAFFSVWGMVTAWLLALGTYSMTFVTDIDGSILYTVETEYIVSYAFMGFGLVMLIRLFAVVLTMFSDSYTSGY